jgi:hypothetical protein
MSLFAVGIGGIATTASVNAVELVSININGTNSGNGSSFDPKISSNGRFMVFSSHASDLVARDSNYAEDVFLRDLQNGTTTLVSVNKQGTDSGKNAFYTSPLPFKSHSNDPVISANNRFVAFTSRATDLVDTFGGDSPKFNIFVRDLQSKTTALVSVNKDGSRTGNYSSQNPVISRHGNFVAFTSYADDLVETDTNGTWDVFVRDLQNGTTTLVTVNKDGTDSGYCESYPTRRGNPKPPVISADGRFVAFTSYAGDLVDNDTNGCSMEDIFIRDLQNGTTTLVNINVEGVNSGLQDYTSIDMSADGRFIVFSSRANDLVESDNDTYIDVFVRDLQTATTKLVSINKNGTGSGSCWSDPYHCHSYDPVITPDGRFVTFSSKADDLVDVDSNDRVDVFVRDLQMGTTSLVSINRNGTDSGSCRSDATSCRSYRPGITPDGRFVTFSSNAYDLVATDTFNNSNVFLRDLQDETTILISENINGTGSSSNAYTPRKNGISPDGRLVALASYGNDLVATDTNDTHDIFMFDAHDIRLNSIDFDHSSVNAGDRTYATISLTDPVPIGDFRISLHNSNPEVATIPNSLVIRAGADSRRFGVVTNAEACATRTLISATGAKNRLSEYLFISSDNRRPGTPTGLEKSASRRMSLSWDKDLNVDKYILDRKKRNQAWENIAELPGRQTFYTPPPQTPCIGYQYRLRAANQCGRSAPAYIGHLDVNRNCPF